MNVRFGLGYESFKLIWGDLAKFSAKLIAEFPQKLNLVACKNDTLAFQLLVSADEPFALNLSKAPCFPQKGDMKTVRAELCLPLEFKMSHIGLQICDDNYYRADILLDTPVAECEKDGVLSVFCEAKIPSDFKEKSVCGELRLYSSHNFEREELIGTAEIRCEIFNFTLPENRDNGFHLDLWQHPTNIARYYGVELWSEEHFEILERFTQSAGELGVKSASVIASEVPWFGQSCRNEQRFKANFFEYSMISVVRKANGELACDYSVMQRYIDLCAKYGINECISVFGLVNVWDAGERTAPDYPDGIHIRVFDEATGAYDYLRTAKELDIYIKSLENYFNGTNQNGRVRIAADEPGDVEAYRKSLEHIKAVAPSFKYKTAINHAEFVNEFGTDIFDFAPYIAAMFSEYDALMSFKAQMPEKRFLYYVCCCPEIPNSFLRSELTDCYYTGILAALAKMDGFLRWSYTVWTEDPVNDSRYGPFPVGDLCLVYPGKSGKPMLSLRWVALKKGIKYFALFKEAEKRGLTEALNKAYSLVCVETDPKKLYGVWEREKMMSVNYIDYLEAEKVLLTALEEK